MTALVAVLGAELLALPSACALGAKLEKGQYEYTENLPICRPFLSIFANTIDSFKPSFIYEKIPKY